MLTGGILFHSFAFRIDFSAIQSDMFVKNGCNSEHKNETFQLILCKENNRGILPFWDILFVMNLLSHSHCDEGLVGKGTTSGFKAVLHRTAAAQVLGCRQHARSAFTTCEQQLSGLSQREPGQGSSEHNVHFTPPSHQCSCNFLVFGRIVPVY